MTAITDLVADIQAIVPTVIALAVALLAFPIGARVLKKFVK